jgi:hypothetical protein
MEVDKFISILEICASQGLVRQDVKRNYWDNLWWPQCVKDWRLKILFSGLSARTRYNLIDKYRTVIEQLNQYGFERLTTLDEAEFKAIVTPLGLMNKRWKFWQSLQAFCIEYASLAGRLSWLSHDELIDLLRKRIWGVGYNIAQSSALYIRGYNCGIIVVDAGMKDILGPCLGFETSRGEKGYRLMRKQLEALASKVNYLDLLPRIGYADIAAEMVPGEVNYWWVHLVLIYFKREFCNKLHPIRCPLLQAGLTKDDTNPPCARA